MMDGHLLLGAPARSKRGSGPSRTKAAGRPPYTLATSRRDGQLAGAVLAGLLGVFVVLQCLLPLRTAIQIGADEGFELTKATLCRHGYKLYAEVWNDQPPLHTYLITQVLKHLSPAVSGPRPVTVAFTTVLLGVLFLIIHRTSGLMVAGLACALVMGSPGFLELGSSCMLEIPALALALAALCVLVVVRETRWRLAEMLAGVLFGLALQMKLVTMILLPLAALIIWLRRRGSVPADIPPPAPTTGGERKNPHSRDPVKPRGPSRTFFPTGTVRAGLLFATSLGISFVAIALLVTGGAYLHHFQQSWSSHFAPARSFEYGSPEDHPFDWSVLLKNWDATIPALLGITVSLGKLRKMPMAALPTVWLALMLAVFATHKPWWPYYYLHVAIPLCWCAALGWEAFGRRVRAAGGPGPRLFFAMLAVCAAGWMGLRVYLQVMGIRRSPQTYSSLVLKEIERLKPFTRFMYSDDSIYSFHAGIPMPPELAVVPLKRLWSGDLTNARIIERMRAVSPEVVLLRNDTREVPFQDMLEAEYRVVYQDSQHRLYTQKALAKRAGY